VFYIDKIPLTSLSWQGKESYEIFSTSCSERFFYILCYKWWNL